MQEIVIFSETESRTEIRSRKNGGAMIIDLTQMKPGQSGRIVEFQGGHHFLKKVQSMGVRQGKKITKVSSHFWRGPQTVEVDNSRFAIGFGMARKILVEVEDKKDE